MYILFGFLLTQILTTCLSRCFHHLNICHKKPFLLNKSVNNLQSSKKKNINALKKGFSMF